MHSVLAPAILPSMTRGPLAVVMGDGDLVTPLGMAGIRTALMAPPVDPARFSRHASEVLPWVDPWAEPETVVQRLLALAAREQARPVLMPQTDGDLIALSRERARLAMASDFVIADEQVIEDVVDKQRFRALAERLGLPVPPARSVSPAGGDRAEDLGLRLPVIVKPVRREYRVWSQLEPHAKAVHAHDEAELRELWARLAAFGIDVLVQELVPGGEERIESYHAYVDRAGATLAEFTGRKIRTNPPSYGHSTALETTDAADVVEVGRDVAERLGLRGPLKVDFKRAPDGTLYLLEVNPRFNLWHHLGAVAGVNLAAVAYADATGAPPPATAPAARVGVRWCLPLEDLRAARAGGMPVGEWLRFLASCESRSNMKLRDPLPFVRGVAEPIVRGRAQRLLARG